MAFAGRTIAHYEIVDEISRGGMGIVYRARDLRLNREVALKMLPQELVADPARRARFVQEAQAASAIEHPHIAVIHEINEADGIYFIAMELVRGDKLSEVTARGPLPASRALDLGIEIAEGLARAHDRNIVHRDLKPANVMLTEDGHAKIIDFGLAKLVEALSGDADGATVLKAETDPGVVLGTVSYMSPEQARGGKVDHRTDVFSFGILLHELLTGRPPFRGTTGIDTMHAILHDPVPPLPSLGGTISADATRDIARVLDKCLAKEPDERYQGMRDIVVDLRAARRRLETSAVPAATSVSRLGTPEGFMRAKERAYVLVAVVAAVALGLGYLRTRTGGRSDSATSSSAKPSLAVMYFENNTGNAQLDWLRTGLADMLVTDLSQSPDIEVLPTDRLVQILGQLRRQDDRVISFDTVQEIAKRAGVTTVVLGSYVKSGDTIRINLKLQDAMTGRLVTSERVEAINESSLFPSVDDLTRRIKARFLPHADPTQALIKAPTAITTTTGTKIDRDLKEVTTSSIEAYRLYAEGIHLHERGQAAAAAVPLERAVQIDPNFALALTKLAVIHNNLGHSNLRRQYAARALQHIERLTPRERYYIEGYYYADRNDTLAKAIDAYEKGIELYPDAASSRNNLALMYLQLERHEDAIRNYEDLRRRKFEFPGTYRGLSAAYTALGAFDKGRSVLDEYIHEHPDSSGAYTGLGDVLLAEGKFDEAATAFGRALQLVPSSPLARVGLHDAEMLRERWTDADAIGRSLAADKDSFPRVLGGGVLAVDAVVKGHFAQALKLLDAMLMSEGVGGSAEAAIVRNGMAGMLLRTNRPAEALVIAERAMKDAAGRTPEFESLGLTVEAHARLGHAAEAARVLQMLRTQANALPSDREKRRVLLVEGVLALHRGDTEGALRALTVAEQRLAPSFGGGPVPPHVPIWFAAGEAHLAARHDGEAAKRFQKVVDGGMLRAGWPIEFIRSLYYLAQIAERRGDKAGANGYYRRFLQYWGEGEIDSERVADARKKVAATTVAATGS